MNTSKTIAVLVATLASLIFGTASAGEAVTYTGTGTYVASHLLMPLGNGGAAVTLTNRTVATISPSDPGFIFGECAGLGFMTAEGDMPETIFYCTFRETEEDSFDLKGLRGLEGGKAEVIGGSGKWAGATGTGTFQRKYQGGNRGSYNYELTITTP